jgi:hypothetical protein
LKAFLKKYKRALIIIAILIAFAAIAATTTLLILDSQKKALAQAESQLASFDAKYDTAVSNVEMAFNNDVSKKAELRTQVDAVIPEMDNLSTELNATFTEIGKIKLTQDNQASVTKELAERQTDVENLQALVFSVNYGLDSLDFYVSNYFRGIYAANTLVLASRISTVNEQNPSMVQPYLEVYISAFELFGSEFRVDPDLESKLFTSRMELISQLKNDAN